MGTRLRGISRTHGLRSPACASLRRRSCCRSRRFARPASRAPCLQSVRQSPRRPAARCAARSTGPIRVLQYCVDFMHRNAPNRLLGQCDRAHRQRSPFASSVRNVSGCLKPWAIAAASSSSSMATACARSSGVILSSWVRSQVSSDIGIVAGARPAVSGCDRRRIISFRFSINVRLIIPSWVTWFRGRASIRGHMAAGHSSARSPLQMQLPGAIHGHAGAAPWT
jgi:hypothetical protein